MTNFARGQKAKLADLGCIGVFPVLLNMAGMEVDIACFGLDANDQLSDDRYMVFFNQKSSPNNAVVLELGSGSASFTTDLARLPDSIHKLVFAASVSGEGVMSQLGASSMRLGDAVFAFSGADFQAEKAVIVGELYRRDGLWRFGAVGQGFNGGLSALLKHFGGTEAEASTPAPVPAAKPISLSKITLEKRGDKVSLEKNTSGGFGRIRVNLNWNQSAQLAEPEKSGFFNKLINKPAPSNNQIDLDLACLFQMADGTPGGVQALGNSWGSFSQPPFVHLEGDDRSGSNAGGENIFINGDQFNQIKRLLIFTFIYEGAPNWAATDGVVTIEVPGRAPVEVRLDQGSNASMCAIAMIENIGGNLQVTKLVEYFAQTNGKSAHEQLNDKFGFGLRFKKGSKD